MRTQERAGRQSNLGHPSRVLVMGQAPLKRQRIGKLGQDDRLGIHTCLCVLSTQFKGHFTSLDRITPPVKDREAWHGCSPWGRRIRHDLATEQHPALVCLRKVSSLGLGSSHP